jgi:hypothetical protein
MLYAASHSTEDVRKSHKEVLEIHTGQLNEQDLEYFRTWDRLIDLEADATQSSVAEAWLERSEARERRTARCISSLVYAGQVSKANNCDDTPAFLVFKRSEASSLRTPFSALQIKNGSYIICSTDSTTLDVSSKGHGMVERPNIRRSKGRFRHQMKVFRGTVERIDSDDQLVIRTSPETPKRLDELIDNFEKDETKESTELLFRLDTNDTNTLVGTLRRNLIDLLTKDREKPENGKGEPDLRALVLQKRFSRHRDLIIRLQTPIYSAEQQRHMFNPPPGARTLPGCDPIELAMDFSSMNGDQRSAVEKVYFTSRFSFFT